MCQLSVVISELSSTQKTFSVGQKLQSDNKHTKNNSLFPMMSCEDSGDELCLFVLLNRPL